MPRVVHFEVHAEHPDRAIRFYTELFGWQFTKQDLPMPYWLIRTGDDAQPGINGGLMGRMGGAPMDGQPVNAYVCTVDVESVDHYFQRAILLGGTAALPKMPIPGIGWLAYVKDTEGNILGMMQNDPTAAP